MHYVFKACQLSNKYSILGPMSRIPLPTTITLLSNLTNHNLIDRKPLVDDAMTLFNTYHRPAYTTNTILGCLSLKEANNMEWEV